MSSRVITRRRAGIILAVVGIAVDIAVIVRVRPDRAGKAADRRADSGALDHADARNYRSDRRAADAADGRILRTLTVRRARAEHGGASKRQSKNGFTHRSFSRFI